MSIKIEKVFGNHNSINISCNFKDYNIYIKYNNKGNATISNTCIY